MQQEKVTMIKTYLLILSLSISPLLATAQVQSTGQDFIVMFKNVPNNPTIVKITLNSISGYNEICPSRNCNIELGTPIVSTPNPDQQCMGYILAFNLIDKMSP